MNSDDESRKGVKTAIIIACIAVVAVAVFAAVFGIMKKTGLNDSDSDKSSTTYYRSTTESSSSKSNGEAVIAPENDDVPQAISTTDAAKRNDGSSLPEGTASKLIKGTVATNRWTASSVISTVTAERVRVNLDVYEDGNRTSQTRARYMYAAIVETRPSRISFISTKQLDIDNVSGIPAMVRSFEEEIGSDVLFACSNEQCARNDDNPNENMYYDDNNNLEGTVIKNGTLAQQGKSSLSLTIDRDGNWTYPVRVSLSTSEEIIKLGGYNSVSYTYPVIWDGSKYNSSESKIAYDIMNDFDIAPSDSAKKDRTLIGQIDENKYAFLISDGFSGGYLVDYMLNELGAKKAYWGSGGYATGMYIKGYGVITSNNYIAHGDLFCVK